LGRRLTAQEGLFADALATHPPMAKRIAILRAWDTPRSRRREGASGDRVARSRALRTIHEFRTRLARYHLQQRRTAKAASPPTRSSSRPSSSRTGALADADADVRRRVEQYVDEIVPQLNVLSYYRSAITSPRSSSTAVPGNRRLPG